MKITCMSDLHGEYPKLPGGDLLILCGDYTASDKILQWVDFHDWLDKQNYRKILYIGGNHDGFLSQCASSAKRKEMYEYFDRDPDLEPDEKIEYLWDSGSEFEGLKIWGSPWSLWFQGINPDCKYFTGSESDLKKKFDLIPQDTDILITHSPPWGVLDEARPHRMDRPSKVNGIDRRCGSRSLRTSIERVKPKIHIFGHIHEQGGKELLLKHEGPNTWCINASIMNADYQAVNKPINIELERTKNGLRYTSM